MNDLKDSLKEDEKDFYDEGLDDKVDAAAEKILASIDPDAIKENVLKQLKEKDNSKVSSMLGKEYLTKDVSKMTGREKGVTFAQAVIRGDTGVLKALSEGQTIEGGYLVPEEFAAMVIRDLADGETILKETATIAMHRDTMKIPGLTDGPKVYWTSERAAKSTTTATFTEHTLTAFKCAAILYATDELVEDSKNIDIVQYVVKLFSEEMTQEMARVTTVGTGVEIQRLSVERLIAKTVNSVKTLTRATLSQALLVIARKVQRIADETLWVGNSATSAVIPSGI